MPAGPRCHRLIGSGDHIEQQLKIAGAARHGSHHRKIGIERECRHARRGSTERNQALARLVREHPAKVGRHTQRAAEVGAKL
jgi:hypothetical protein